MLSPDQEMIQGIIRGVYVDKPFTSTAGLSLKGKFEFGRLIPTGLKMRLLISHTLGLLSDKQRKDIRLIAGVPDGMTWPATVFASKLTNGRVVEVIRLIKDEGGQVSFATDTDARLDEKAKRGSVLVVEDVSTTLGSIAKTAEVLGARKIAMATTFVDRLEEPGVAGARVDLPFGLYALARSVDVVPELAA